MRVLNSTAAMFAGLCLMLSACSNRDNNLCDKNGNQVAAMMTPTTAQTTLSPKPQRSISDRQSKHCEEKGFWQDYNVAMEQILEFSQFSLKLLLTPGASDNVSYTFHQNTGSTHAPDCQHSTHSEVTDDGLV